MVVFVHELSKRSMSSRNHRAAAKQDAVHVKEDAHLMRQTGETHTRAHVRTRSLTLLLVDMNLRFCRTLRLHMTTCVSVWEITAFLRTPL